MPRHIRSFLIGTLLLPLSLLPFFVYGTQTPEGRLIVDRARAMLVPPELPDHDPSERERIRTQAPSYTDGVMVLVYHGIGSGSSGEGDSSVSPEQFADQLATMRTAGMVPVTMQEVADAFRGGRELPPNAVAITFDDGRTDAMLFADPLLEKAGWKATMYVITGQAEQTGSPYYVSWDELEGHHGSGRWDLQAHTDDLHRMVETATGEFPALTSRGDAESLSELRARIRADLESSVAAITEHTGVRPRTFAYPFGAYGGDDRTNDPAIQAIVADEVERVFDLAVEQDGQDSPILATTCDDPLHLHRLEVGNWDGTELLERIDEAVGRTDCSRQPRGAMAGRSR